MAVRPITVIGHKALHSRTKKVKEVTDEVRTLVADMFDTMEAADGVGLAANQVASRLRIFVYDCPVPDGPNARGVVVNPVLERLGTPAPLDPEDDDDADMGSAPPTKVDRRRARAMAKAEATSARLRQLEEPRGAAARDPSAPSSEDDDAMWDYMDVDVALPPRLADLDTPTGR